MIETKSARQTWWVAIKNADGSEDEPEVAQVWFNGSAVEEVLRLGREWGFSPSEVRLIEPVIPARRALTVDAIWEAFAASDKHDTGHVGRLQVEDRDWEGEPTGRAYTLIDGYFDLQRVAEILSAGGDAP